MRELESGIQTGKVFTGLDSLKRLASYPHYTTGSAEIDRILGGGLKGGRLVMVFGKSNSGKSQLAMQSALHAAKAGVRSLYLDTEGAFRPERVEGMSSAKGWRPEPLLSKIVYLRCKSAAEQADAVIRMSQRSETADCRLVVVDTLTTNFSLELPGAVNMPDRQGALNAHLSQMARDAFLNGRAYLLTNRVTFGQGDTDVGVGGSTVDQLVHVSLRLERVDGRVRVSDAAGGRACLVSMGESGIGAQ